jgi:hypothetical protein
MAINLSRNTKMYISTATLATANQPVIGDFDNTNTYEVPVLDGYSFSQDVETQNITLNEASCTPSRGQKVYNTALNPVEVSFPTYMKPYKPAGAGTNAVEQILWEAFVGNDSLGTNAVPGTTTNPLLIDFAKSNTHELGKIHIIFVLDNTAYVVNDVGVNQVDIDFAIDQIASLSWTGQGARITEVPEIADSAQWVANTDYVPEAEGQTPEFIKNKLSQVEVWADTNQDFDGYQVVNYGGALVGADTITIPDATYEFNISVDGGTEETVSVTTLGTTTVTALLTLVNTALDGTTDTNKATATIDAYGNLMIQSDDTGSAGAASTSISLNETGVTAGSGLFTNLGTYNANVTFIGIMTAIDGLAAGQQYLVPITGGTMTLNNNVTYLTPEELGKVNVPIAGGFTGTREFGGSLTAYLNTGANRTGGLLTDLTSASALANATNRFYINISIGGCGTTPRVDIEVPQAQLTIPTVNVEDVLSTEIGFTAIATDLNLADELTVKYYATQ